MQGKRESENASKYSRLSSPFLPRNRVRSHFARARALLLRGPRAAAHVAARASVSTSTSGEAHPRQGLSVRESSKGGRADKGGSS